MSDFKPASAKDVAALIDHTLLKPGAGREDIRRRCAEAAEWHTASVCVHPIWVREAALALQGSGVPVCTVIAFPHGASTPRAILAETDQARMDGATEFDLVIPWGAGRAGDWDAVREAVRAVRQGARELTVKAILETSELNSDEIRKAAETAVQGGADYLKTSTGFASGGATVDSVRLLAEVAGDLGVKASGGIRSYDDVVTMVEAGATRIGASGTRAILDQARAAIGR